MDIKSSWLAKRFIAHRGFHSDNGDYPENSLAAFQRAMENDFAIELDVHILSDGKIIVFHDDDLKRMTGVDGSVEQSNYKDIKKLRLCNSKHGIPLIEDVLKLVDGRVPLLVELKNQGKAGPLEEGLCKTLRRYSGEFAVQSFNPFSMKWFKENAPGIIRGQLSGEYKDHNMAFYKKFLLKNFLLNGESCPAFVNYDINGAGNWALERQRKKRLLLLGWTARSREQYETAKKYFDNVVFEGFNPGRV